MLGRWTVSLKKINQRKERECKVESEMEEEKNVCAVNGGKVRVWRWGGGREKGRGVKKK